MSRLMTESVPSVEKNCERQFLDVLRGIAVFLMIWGHVIQYSYCNSNEFYNNWVFKTIYSFHMPLFMMISGYLFYYSSLKRNFEELLAYKTQQFFQPIIMGTLLNWMLTSVLLPVIVGGVKGIRTLFLAEYLGQLGTLSFLWSVLAATLVTTIVMKKIENPYIRILGFVLGLFVVAMFPGGAFNLFLYPYFVIGFYISKTQKEVARKLKIVSGGGNPFIPLATTFL